MVKDFLQLIISAIIFCPILLFVIVYIIGRKIKIRGTHAFGVASDATTFCLFFSVPLAIAALWQINIGVLLVIVSIMLAMIFTYVEWRTKKEIEVKPLLKKIWRFQFLLLSMAYIAICLIGIIQSIINYLQVV
ncbi:DUF3397 domain-containing protein [Lysinibacillus piscis]|uniref:DUF3397 domain-containing protein n=1 Tax=Lysinibacillus piscis TaxID=2518931 RepID=A0ABQ5NHJ9_9BACI|nr:DUF3397 domain-containing protein [Lysinibacillus sp. KH24]GLC87562.1 hypothetical protein LYSBPC_06890 [Lysinibacillus sp. KH24]